MPEPQTPAATLAETIADLAARDAAPRADLARIARLARRELPRCDAVSITYAGDAGYTTVEADPELVRAVDEAQYADGGGPCRPAVRVPAGGDFDTSIQWPAFRAQSLRLGLRSVAAVPLFTAGGRPVASLYIWSRSPDALDPLRAALVALFDSHAQLADWVTPAGLDPGERELLQGLRCALELGAVIHRAVGYLAAQRQVPLGEAFQRLRADAHLTGTDVAGTARQLLPS